MQSMYSRPVHWALLAIRDNIRLAREFVVGFTLDSFGSDQRSIYAVTRCLEIISEASRRLPDDLVSRHPHVPWHQIRAAGNIYRHKYDNVSPAVLWTTLESGLDDLDRAVATEIEAIEKLGSHLSQRNPQQ
jgi:uncharacterized protein with HEPN domain